MTDQQRREEDRRFLDHEKRLHDLEPVVESLQWHHRNDKLLERMNNAENAIRILEKAPKKNGDGDVRARIGWLEKVAFMAIGAIAAFEFYVRIIK